MISSIEAKHELQQFFHDGWKEGLLNGPKNLNLTPLGFSYNICVFFQNVELLKKMPNNEHFVRFTVSNIETSQRTMPGGRANGSSTKYLTPGVGFVELFFSKNNYQTTEDDYLSLVAERIFLGQRSENVIFRKTTLLSLPETEKHFRSTVSFQYEFETHI